MGGVNVKNTIVERMLQIIAPYLCFGCGQTGVILCDDCKYDITSEPFVGCFVCGAPKSGGVCEHHNSPIQFSYIATSYSSVVKSLIRSLKFNHLRSASKDCAELLHNRLPTLPEGAILVPVPTVRSHIRERGYDQAALIAAHLGKLRGVPVVSMISRVNKSTQHTLGRTERIVQAGTAFLLKAPASPNNLPIGPIIVVDDVVTTGATAEAMARSLEVLGLPIWLAAVAYKPVNGDD